MDDYTHPPKNGWTVETVLAYTERHLHDLDRRIDERNEWVDERFALANQATEKALASAESARLKAEDLAAVKAEQSNNWHSELTKAGRDMMPRSEYSVIHRALESQVAALAQAFDRHAGEREGGDRNTYVIYLVVSAAASALAAAAALAAVIVAVAAIVLRFVH